MYTVCCCYTYVLYIYVLYFTLLIIVYTYPLQLLNLSTYLAYAGNPYALFALLYSETFTEVIEHLDLLTSPSSPTPPEAGSVEDALLFQQGIYICCYVY